MTMTTVDHCGEIILAGKASQRVLISTLLFILSLSLSISLLHLKYESDGGVQSFSDNSTIIPIDHTIDEQECSCYETDHRSSSSIAASFGLHGEISDCCCTFQTIEQTNQETVYPLLQRIVATPFFAHFKIDLCSDCELWHDAPLCVLRDCGVCECEEPPEWAAEVVDWMPNVAIYDADDDDCEHVDDQVETMVNSHVTESWDDAFSPITPSFFDKSPSLIGEEVDNDRAVVVDLRLNPERYTGYAGHSADKVWAAIHQDNCFQYPEDHPEDDEATDVGYCTLPAEQRVYNKIISGMHSSISLHIAHSYCLEMDTDRIAECKTWGLNTTLAHERVLDHPDRLENLYVVFAVMLRAVQKAGGAIAAAVPNDDPFFAESLSDWTEYLLPEINEMMKSCPMTFDESSLFSGSAIGEDVESKRVELKRRFKQLLEIMQCVGCDRCKLWGTLQTLGVGTALRIILDDDESQGTNLSRQEAVALVHTLERFSSALVYTHELQKDE